GTPSQIIAIGKTIEAAEKFVLPNQIVEEYLMVHSIGELAIPGVSTYNGLLMYLDFSIANFTDIVI
ncbi:MAG: hypothetical protein PVF32_22815, partial [Desulfobacterales bacterium]